MMTYALMALLAAREFYRHFAKLMGWKQRYGTRRSHELHAGFALGVLVVALGNLFAWPPLAVSGWIIVGFVFIGLTTAPCSIKAVNTKPILWYARQVFVFSSGMGVLAYAAGIL